MDEEKGSLAKVGAIVGIAVGIATIASIAWSVFHKESTEVPDYQKQVVATCEQVHSILSREHGEVFDLGFSGGSQPDGPEDLFRVKKAVLLQVMSSNLAQSRAAFEALNSRSVPAALKDRHEAARAAQDAWYEAVQSDIDTVSRNLRDGDTIEKVNELSAGSGTPAAGVQLNSAMSELAGERCQSTT